MVADGLPHAKPGGGSGHGAGPADARHPNRPELTGARTATPHRRRDVAAARTALAHGRRQRLLRPRAVLPPPLQLHPPMAAAVYARSARRKSGSAPGIAEAVEVSARASWSSLAPL
ncbi:hypothetical protein C2845_PM05G01870 [Panicum miliaceum]|uniref:Uncharacterized protein n=1 Tax=Panicum miliaceum TaxID=4540 RepID=A0A3L6STH3_PANMI|nr:hypothetical protein C2845_PM05G01870 [Panicum miliaceum]